MSIPSYLLAAVCLTLGIVAICQAYQLQQARRTIADLRRGVTNANRRANVARRTEVPKTFSGNPWGHR